MKNVAKKNVQRLFGEKGRKVGGWTNGDRNIYKFKDLCVPHMCDGPVGLGDIIAYKDREEHEIKSSNTYICVRIAFHSIS